MNSIKWIQPSGIHWQKEQSRRSVNQLKQTKVQFALSLDEGLRTKLIRTKKMLEEELQVVPLETNPLEWRSYLRVVPQWKESAQTDRVGPIGFFDLHSKFINKIKLCGLGDAEIEFVQNERFGFLPLSQNRSLIFFAPHLPSNQFFKGIKHELMHAYYWHTRFKQVDGDFTVAMEVASETLAMTVENLSHGGGRDEPFHKLDFRLHYLFFVLEFFSVFGEQALSPLWDDLSIALLSSRETLWTFHGYQYVNALSRLISQRILRKEQYASSIV